MVGRRGAVAAAFIMVAIGLSGCTALGGSGSTLIVEAPAWKAGFTWSYDSKYNATWTDTFDGETESDYYDDEGSHVYRVLNTTMDIEGIPVYFTVMQQDGRWQQPVAFRRADLAEIWMDYDYNYCQGGDCYAELKTSLYLDEEEIPTYFDFPLTEGKKWSEILTEDEFIEIEIAYSSKVTGVKLYQSEAVGEVKVVVVERTIGLANVDEVLKAFAEEWEEEEGVTIHEMRGDFKTKVVEYYSPVYQNIVYQQRTSSSTFYMDVTEEGERFEVSEESRSTDTLTLTGASLVPGPEQDVQGIVGYISGNVDVVSPAGQVVEEAIPVTYSIAIETLQDGVNVAEQEVLQFDMKVDGELPPEHQISWTATNLGGQIIAESETGFFTFTPTTPGGFLIAVQTHAGGDVIAEDFTTAVAHYTGQLVLECGLAEVAGNGIPDDCAMESIPVHPGVASLAIEAYTSSPADSANAGTIRVLDAAGRTIDASSSGNAKSLQINDFAGMGLSGAAWKVDWYQTAGAGEQAVEMDVDVQYLKPALSQFPAQEMPVRLESPWVAVAEAIGLRR